MCACILDYGKEQTWQDADNHEYDEKFNEREGSAPVIHDHILPGNWQITTTVVAQGTPAAMVGNTTGGGTCRRHRVLPKNLHFGQHHSPALARLAAQTHKPGRDRLFEEDVIGVRQPSAGRQISQQRRFIEFPRDKIGGWGKDLGKVRSAGCHERLAIHRSLHA